MPGIEIEIRIFLYAILTGVLDASVYLWLMVFRRIFPHRLWMLNLEDFCYWLVSALYTFVQIYHISDGILRWYIGLGILIGAVGMLAFSIGTTKAYQKIFERFCEKRVKSVDKSG